MADESVRTGTFEGDDDPLVDLLTADQNSAFPDDEELNEQRSGETDGDDQTSLTAAHQGARATPPGNSTAFTPAADGDLLDEGSELAGAQTRSANRAFGTTLAGDAPDAIQGNLDFELSVGDGNAAHNAGERGGDQRSATAAERTSTTFDQSQDAAGAGAAGVAAVQSFFDDIAAEVQPVFANIGSAFNSLTNSVLEIFNDSGPGRSNDGLGGSGDQDGSVSSGDDVVEYVEDPTTTTSDGNNDIIGDKFDNNLVGTDASEMINAKGGDDTLSGGGGDDYLKGKQGDDSLDGGTGADTLSGGGGDDVLIWDSSDTVIDGGTGTDTLRVESGSADFTTFAGSISNIETIDLQSDTGANTVTLSAQNVLDMTDSGNTLTITGDAGDSLEAGDGWTDAGFDGDGNHIYTQVVGGQTATLLVDPDITANADMVDGGGTAGDDTLTGTAFAEALDGLAGNDSLSGAGGDDTLTGGAGSDTLSGGTGDDVLIWDSSDAVIDGGNGTDTLQVDSGDADFTTFGGSITNIETVDLQSDTGANTVTLSAQNVLDMTDNGNTLTITGDTGDSLEAGTGWTDGGFDGDGNQIYTQVVGAKTATLLVDPDITANADMLPDVATTGDDILTGTAADDTFDGLAGNDAITGAGGDDTLTGGLGDDTMLGGAGDDTFTFTDTDFDGAAWTDTVDGFVEGGDLDVIDLTGVSQGWTLEVDGAGAGAEATDADKPSRYTGDEMSGTITFEDGSTIAFDNIEKVDW